MGFESGKVYISRTQPTAILTDPIIIDDRTPSKCSIKTYHSDARNYILKYLNGTNTLPVFKTLVTAKNFNIVFLFVDNIESFYKDFAYFINYDFIYFDIKHKKNDRIKKYRALVHKIKRSREIKDINNKGEDERGLEISFTPDILSSVQTSLESPESYLTYIDCSPSKIYLALKDGPKNFTELNLLNIANLTKHIKSLIYCDIIEKKGELYKIKLDVL